MQQSLAFLMKERFQALLPLGSHELKQLRNSGFVCLVSLKHFSLPCSCQLWKVLLLWHRGPLYPGAQSQVPSSGEQEPPFSQLHEMEQLGPQRPWVQMLSQWMPKDTKPHVRGFPQLLLCSLIKEMLGWTDASQSLRANEGVWEGNSSSFICLIK